MHICKSTLCLCQSKLECEAFCVVHTMHPIVSLRKKGWDILIPGVCWDYSIWVGELRTGSYYLHLISSNCYTIQNTPSSWDSEV